MRTEAEVRAAADALAKRMGDGWEPEVWENSGWYYKVKKGNVTIHAHDYGSRPVTYAAWINPEVILHNRVVLQIIADGDTPEDALGFAVQDARTMVSRVNATLAEVS